MLCISKTFLMKQMAHCIQVCFVRSVILDQSNKKILLIHQKEFSRQQRIKLKMQKRVWSPFDATDEVAYCSVCCKFAGHSKEARSVKRDRRPKILQVLCLWNLTGDQTYYKACQTWHETKNTTKYKIKVFVTVVVNDSSISGNSFPATNILNT